MENIRQAIERAKAGHATATVAPAQTVLKPPSTLPSARPEVSDGSIHEIELKDAHLQSNRIIAQNGADHRAKPYDMLRTQVLQSMDLKGWKILGVTSPSPECGKSLTAINLALSIARQSDRSVLLVDMDLQKPRVASYLGVSCDKGILGILENRVGLPDAIVHTRIGNHRLMVLPAEAPTSGSSEWMVSRPMSAMMQRIKMDYQSRIVIVDLPPMLSGDDVLGILPQMDCILLVAMNHK
jgi:protein-tyrosine kinase